MQLPCDAGIVRRRSRLIASERSSVGANSQPLRITCAHTDNGTEFSAAPLGLRPGHLASLFALGAVFAPLGVFVGLLILLGHGNPKLSPLVGLVPLLAFGGSGALMLCISTHFAFCRTVLTARTDSIHCTRRGPFGTQRRTWPREQVVDAEVGASNIKMKQTHGNGVPGKPVLQLQLRLADGTRAAMLTGYPQDELTQLAASLHQLLSASATMTKAREATR